MTTPQGGNTLDSAPFHVYGETGRCCHVLDVNGLPYSENITSSTSHGDITGRNGEKVLELGRHILATAAIYILW